MAAVDTYGDIVELDLASGQSVRRPFGEAAARRWIGGRGLATLVLCQGAASPPDPLGPDNPLTMAAGLLTGSGAPAATRVQVTARSPLTGLLGSSNVGGGFGFALRAAGVTALVLRGQAPRWSAVVLREDGDVALVDARDLVGLETGPALDALAGLAGGERQAALVIGPAGERRLPLACLVSRGGHAAGRTGLGAVLGAKRVKGVVAVEGEPTVPRTPARLAAARHYVRAVRESPTFPQWSRYGSTFGVEWGNARGILATRNYRTGRSPQAEAVDSTSIHRFFQRRAGCRTCPVQCKADLRLPDEDGEEVLQRPDFEPLVAWGPQLGIDDAAAVVRLHHRCDELGLDSISAASAIAFATDLYERGIIGLADTDGIALRWGAPDTAAAILEGMGRGQGFPGLLARGVRQAAAVLGRGSERFAFHVKGLELSAYDPRAALGTALGYAVCSRGGDYTAVYVHHEFDPPPELAMTLYGTPAAGDPLSPAGKAEMVRRAMVVSAAVDSLGLCKVPVLSLLDRFDLELEADLVRTFSDLPLDATGLFSIGERVVTLERSFNLRCGAGSDDDRLPAWFGEQPLDTVARTDAVRAVEDLRRDYYRLMGWDADGVPRAETLPPLEPDGAQRD